MCCSLEKGNEKMRIEKFILQHRGVLSLKFSKGAYRRCRFKSCPDYKKTFGILENLIYLCCIIKTKT
jgi:hypothetical protein